MSRIGKKSVAVPSGVKVSVNAGSRTIEVQGPKGKLSFGYRPEVKVAAAANEIRCEMAVAEADAPGAGAHWGTTRALVATAIEGVTKGFAEKLEVVGVGWGAKVQGKKIVLTVGFCDPIEIAIPDGVTVAVNQQIIEITGPDKQKVGQLAAQIRQQRKPEPYNGKGIKYVSEVIQRKKGKAFGA